ncbi:hypothetical protein [Micropruina sp.]|uniref:hypothetical protein n=1 Tax=Micropruina sp. TaxID=2737536 RepID=UPI0039E58B37
MGACKVCTHPERKSIDAALMMGMPRRQVAASFGVHRDSMRRHYDRHLKAIAAELTAERERAGATSALDRLEELYGRTKRILDLAEEEGKASLSLAAVRELRGIVEVLARVTGELDEKPTVTVNLAASPEWQQVQTLILAALAPYAEARQAVVLALDSAETVPGEVVQ